MTKISKSVGRASTDFSSPPWLCGPLKICSGGLAGWGGGGKRRQLVGKRCQKQPTLLVQVEVNPAHRRQVWDQSPCLEIAFNIMTGLHNDPKTVALHQIWPFLWFSNQCSSQLTSATLSRRGSIQRSLHSQWLSRNVSTFACAASAPRTRERIKPRNQESTLNGEHTKWLSSLI